MNEISGIEEQVKDPGKRKFLKRVGQVAVAAVGTAALGGMVSNEVRKSENGIVTESGIFFPLYELHDKGIKVESIPEGLDVFFNELILSHGQTFTTAPEDILRITVKHPEKKLVRFQVKY